MRGGQFQLWRRRKTLLEGLYGTRILCLFIGMCRCAEEWQSYFLSFFFNGTKVSVKFSQNGREKSALKTLHGGEGEGADKQGVSSSTEARRRL